MRKFLSLAGFAVVFCIGCSNPIAINDQMTIGATKNIIADCTDNSITVHRFESIATTGDIYFYLNREYDKQMIIPIPDSILYVMDQPFNNLSALITQDAYGRWYMQIIRNGSNLCMSIGANIEIKSFTVRW